jgi:putative endonuclease
VARPGSGQRAERRALWHYRLRGYRVLGANVWSAGYELDLIVRRGRSIVFCEVKSKRGAGFGLPEEMVGPEKRRRLVRASRAWLARNPQLAGLRLSCEVVAVDPDGLRRVALGDLD